MSPAPSPDDLLADTGVSVAAILDAEGFPDASGAAVYLAGSIVSGHANPWSDIDVFAVTDRPPATDATLVASTNTVAPHFVAGRRVDYEFWTPAAVADIARRLDEFEFGAGRLPQGATFLEIEEIFVHRLRTGVALAGAERFAELRAGFDFDKFAAFLTEESIRHLDALVEDLGGMHRKGDADSAIWVGRRTVDVAAAAYLHSCGNTDPVEKWTPRYLRELDGTPFHQALVSEYWDLQLPGDQTAMRGDGARWQAYVEQVVDFAERLTAVAQGD